MAEGYRVLVEELEKPKRSINQGKWSRVDSPFYVFHWYHDQKSTPLGIEGPNHSDRLGKTIADLVTTPERLEYAQQMMEQAVHVRLQFYEQFLGPSKV